MSVFIYICIAFLFTVVQTSFFNLFLPSWISPDLFAIFIVYMAMSRGFREGLLFTLFAGYMLSLNTSVGFLNVSLFSIVTFSVARYVSLNFYTNDIKYLFLTIALPVFANKIFTLFWLRFGNFLIFMEHFLYVILGTIVTALVGIVVFRTFNWIDIITKRINLESVVEE